MTRFLFPYTILSTPTQQSKIINLVPIPQPLSYSKTPILPFPIQIWGLIAFIYVIGIAMLFLAGNLPVNESNIGNKRKSFSHAFFNVLMISLFQSASLEQSFRSHAFIILILLFFSLLLGTLYDGGYASVMTVTRYEKPLSSIHDVVESKFQWKGITIAYLYPVGLTEEPNLRKYIDNFIQFPLTEIKYQSHTTSIFLTEFTQNHCVVNLNNILDHVSAENYMVAKEEITGQYTTVISHKTWPFMEYMNRIIFAITESGIRKHWEYMVCQITSQMLENELIRIV